MPRAPFHIERVAGRPRSLRVLHYAPEGVRGVTVTVPADGAEPEYELEPGTTGPEAVMDVISGAAYQHWDTGAAYDHWRVESSVLTFRWPAGLALASLPGLQPPPFELIGPEESRLWIQGPLPEYNVPSLDGFEGPGQVTDRTGECAGGPLVELTYALEGVPWRMFHCIVDRNPPRRRGVLSLLDWWREPPRYLCIVTAQTPELHAEAIRQAVEEVAVTLTPAPPDPLSSTGAGAT